MKIIKKFISALSVVVFIVCLVLLAIVMITPKNSNGSRVVNIAGYSIMSVLTNSMEDEYNVGDLILIKKTDVSELKEKDVITFYSPDPSIEGAIVTHRIIDITDENGQKLFETKGDNSPAADSYKVSASSIIGKVQGKVPFIGKATNFMQTNKTAFFLIIILPMLVIIASEVRNIVVIARNGEENESEENNK